MNLLAEPEKTELSIGKHSVVYLLGAAASILGGIVLLPVYTHNLSPADYGLLETVLRFINLCIVVAFVGLQQGYTRFYFDGSSDAWHRSLTSTTIIGIVVVGGIAALPVLGVLAYFSNSLGLPRMSISSVLLLSAWLVFEAVYSIGLSFLQVRFMSRHYVTAQCSRAALLVTANFLFLSAFKLGLNGALIGNLVTALVSGTITALLLLRWAGLGFSVSTMTSLVGFGAPFIPTAAFAYVTTNADRLSLLHFGYGATLGLLSLASKLGDMALSVLVMPLNNIWMPYALSVYRDQDGASKIGLLYMRYISMIVFVGLLVSLSAPVAIRLLAASKYMAAADLVPFVSIGCIFFSVSSLSDLGIVIAKKARLKPVIYGSTAVVAVVLQFLLTRPLGLFGAVLATSLTAMTQFLIIHFTARRYYNIEVRWRIVVPVASAFCFSLLIQKALTYFWPTLLTDVIAIGIGVAVYLSVIHSTGLITFHEAMEFGSRLLPGNRHTRG